MQTPSICLPSYTAGLTKLQKQSASVLKNSTFVAQPVSVLPTAYSFHPEEAQLPSFEPAPR